MNKLKFFIITVALLSANVIFASQRPSGDNSDSLSAKRDNYRIIDDNWQELKVEFNISNPKTATIRIDGHEFSNITIDALMSSSEEGAPSLPLFSRLIEVPQCDGFETRISEAEYDTITLTGSRLMPVQPSRSKSDTTHHKLVINNKIYASDAFYGFEPAIVERVGIARDRHLARLQFSPIRYNPVSSQIIVCRHAIVNVRYRSADAEATMAHFKRYHSPLFASGALVMNNLYQDRRSGDFQNSQDAVSTTAPIRYLIVAHSSFRGQMDSFVNWKRRKGFITDIVYTDDPGVGTTTTTIAAYIQSQFTNATAANPAPTYLLIVGDHEQIPAFTGTTSSSHITDLYYISWTAGDNIPDCYCGRFSAQNVAELTPQIEKTLMYEQYTFADPSFLDRAVLVAGVDGGTTGDYGYTHADPAMDYAATHYINSDNGYTQVMYFKNNTSIVPSANGVTIGSSASSNSATVRSYYNQGAGWINYSAHGSATSWGTPNFTTTHVAAMTNSQKFGLVIGNCCLTNKFQTTNCFGESLLRKNNYCGAVGYIGGSNSTYWNEDFYWAVGVRSNINASMSLSYNAVNLGAYDRLFHTHGESYSQWAMSQGSIMMVGNLAVESSTTSRKLYYWEIYHLMGDPSVMPYLTQAPTMTVAAPSVTPIGSNSISVSAAPHAYVALTTDISHELVSATFTDANGNAILPLPATISPGTYELAVSAQQYQTSFSEIMIIPPSGRAPVVLDITPSENLVAGSTQEANLIVANLGDSTSYYVTIDLTPSDSNTLYFFAPGTEWTNTSPQFTIDSISGGDTVIVSCMIQVDNNVGDETTVAVTSSASCIGVSQTVTNIKLFSFIAPVVKVDLSQNSLSIIPGNDATITTVVNNNGHAPLSSNSMTLTSATQLLKVGSHIFETTAPFTLEPGASATFSFTLHADNQIPTGIDIPMSIRFSQAPTNDSLFSVFVGNNPIETFESNTFHTEGWTQNTYPWIITDSESYSGSYCLRSAQTLSHSQTSMITISLTLPAADSISFHYKVSSENNYDKFHFYIDNDDRLIKSGEVDWSRAAFLVPAGTHTLKFSYAKDGSVNSGSDCAWIDNIILPHESHSVTIERLDLCVGDNYSIAGNQLNTSAPTDSSIIVIPTDPQDTIRIVDYYVHPTYNTEENLAVCDSVLWAGQVYTTSSELSHLFETVNGCDSMAICHLTVNNSVAETIYDTANARSYQWNDSIYTMSGSYTQLFATQEGCDSIVTLLLTIVDTNNESILSPQPSALSPQPSIYPNPTHGMLFFDRQVLEVALYDASGRLLSRLREVKSMDISHLPNGVYTLFVVSDRRGTTTTIRVVKK